MFLKTLSPCIIDGQLDGLNSEKRNNPTQPTPVQQESFTCSTNLHPYIIFANNNCFFGLFSCYGKLKPQFSNTVEHFNTKKNQALVGSSMHSKQMRQQFGEDNSNIAMCVSKKIFFFKQMKVALFQEKNCCTQLRGLEGKDKMSR